MTNLPPPPTSAPLPRIIQGGMGVAISDWGLAQAVSRTGQLGVVSGTGIDSQWPNIRPLLSCLGI